MVNPKTKLKFLEELKKSAIDLTTWMKGVKNMILEVIFYNNFIYTKKAEKPG